MNFEFALAAIAGMLYIIFLLCIIKPIKQSKPLTMIQLLILCIIPCLIACVVVFHPSIIEWILSGRNLIIVALTPLLFALLDAGIQSYRNTPIQQFYHNSTKTSKAFHIRFISCCLLWYAMLAMTCFVSDVYESERSWKTIYTNDIHANVTLEFKRVIGGNVVVEPDVELNKQSNIFNQSRNGVLHLTKDGSTETRKIHFEHTSINGQVHEHSKVTKIEYRPVERMHQTLFGFSGQPQPSNVDGEIRITVVDDESHKQLKALLD